MWFGPTDLAGVAIAVIYTYSALTPMLIPFLLAGYYCAYMIDSKHNLYH